MSDVQEVRMEESRNGCAIAIDVFNDAELAANPDARGITASAAR
jgi:hypothetical protein